MLKPKIKEKPNPISSAARMAAVNAKKKLEQRPENVKSTSRATTEATETVQTKTVQATNKTADYAVRKIRNAVSKARNKKLKIRTNSEKLRKAPNPAKPQQTNFSKKRTIKNKMQTTSKTLKSKTKTALLKKSKAVFSSKNVAAQYQYKNSYNVQSLPKRKSILSKRDEPKTRSSEYSQTIKPKKKKQSNRMERQMKKKAKKQAAKQAAKVAKATAKATAKAAEKTAKVSAKLAKFLAKIAAATAKVIIASGLWIVLLVILIVGLVIAFVASPHGIIMSQYGEVTAAMVANECREEFQAEIGMVTSGSMSDKTEMNGTLCDWADVFMVYAVKTSNGTNARSVATFDEENIRLFKEVFWEMNKLDYKIVTDPETEETTLIFTVTNKTVDEMKELYGFTPSQNEQLESLLAYRDTLNFLAVDTGGVPPSALGDGSYAALMAEAQRYIGYPYVYGGSTPQTSFDCSGYICWVYTRSGVYNLPRMTAQGIYNQCVPISPSEAKPSDLIFFEGTYNFHEKITHIGIFVGNGKMLHAGNPIGYANIDSAYWQSHFYGFGRLQ